MSESVPPDNLKRLQSITQFLETLKQLTKLQDTILQRLAVLELKIRIMEHENDSNRNS